MDDPPGHTEVLRNSDPQHPDFPVMLAPWDLGQPEDLSVPQFLRLRLEVTTHLR